MGYLSSCILSIVLSIFTLSLFVPNSSYAQINVPEPKLKIPNLTDYVYNDTMPHLDNDLQEEYDLIEKSRNRTKLLACVVIARNSLAKGNDEVTQAMKETKLDKGQTFDKIYAMMLVNCYNQIKLTHVHEVLRPDNVIVSNPKHLNLIKFNKNFIKIIGPAPKLNEEERFIMSQVEEAENNSEMFLERPEVKRKELLGLGLNTSEEYLIIGGVGSLVSFVLLLFVLRRNRSEAGNVKLE